MTNRKYRSNTLSMTSLRRTEIERRFVATMQVVVALPWLVFGHTSYVAAAMILWIGVGLVVTRSPLLLPRAIASRKPRLLAAGSHVGESW